MFGVVCVVGSAFKGSSIGMVQWITALTAYVFFVAIFEVGNLGVIVWKTAIFDMLRFSEPGASEI